MVNWSATDYQQQLLAYPALFGFWGQALNWWAIIIWLKNDRLPYGQLGLTWLTMTICGAEICSCKLPCVFDAFYERSSNGFRNLCVAWEFSNLNMHSRLLLVDNITITQQAMQVYPKSMQQSQVHAASKCNLIAVRESTCLKVPNQQVFPFPHHQPQPHCLPLRFGLLL